MIYSIHVTSQSQWWIPQVSEGLHYMYICIYIYIHTFSVAEGVHVILVLCKLEDVNEHNGSSISVS